MSRIAPVVCPIIVGRDDLLRIGIEDFDHAVAQDFFAADAHAFVLDVGCGFALSCSSHGLLLRVSNIVKRVMRCHDFGSEREARHDT